MSNNTVVNGTVRSVWITETGRWNARKGTYVDTQLREEKREIGVHLERMPDLDLSRIWFDGPTGFESYRLPAVREVVVSGSSDFCICFGTVNSWPRCLVEVADLRAFLEQAGEVFGETEPMPSLLDFNPTIGGQQ